MWNNLKNFFEMEMRTKYFVHVLFFLFVASAIVFGLLIIGQKSLLNKNKTPAIAKIDPFQEIQLEAKSAVVWDVINNRELFTKEGDNSLPLASLTKVMTALVISAKFPDSSNIQILQEYLEPEGDSNLVVGDIWQASDLRDFTLLTSSNDGAFALAAVAEAKENNLGNGLYTQEDLRNKFIEEMNDTASEIGLSNSRFFNEHGLDRTVDRGGAYGSAKDMAMLFAYTLQNFPDMLEATRYKKLEFKSAEKVYSATNTNDFVDQIPNLIASKTGYTDLAGGNLVIAYDAGLNRPIIISVLGSSTEGRFTDALKLSEASLKYLQQEE
ncbi:MAG: hypothetical protein A2431_04255 [Candidatus Zambryskibacteria bacterium RIFOXYC1_FULL_39_10]|uniref:Peptidase S11 D-alanyl-D-alanine carboxypeptidase A N-terminal domain-containing protein n=1 Tax=Candidatus Zambryskibacteria bacterium RIFOXYC1_FULL_39_10 TaxID=1802779 RepID=A0A1G2V4G7_9BACT|nr:MAG: hypothetical protein A2431_04255 [Candidatus Zambryskibacteria bacterium RIFOXYC1_FULL_39_10]OHB16691.1 MAG: hypothetical protein A2605_00850 [Candidatus Zambryskibacteria bacterium RIFOXYD1_FULL_39_35]